jgi:hypothetical protein
MLLVDIKSRAKRIITIMLPASLQSPTHPSTQLKVRRSKTVKHQAAPVPHDIKVDLPPVLTILPGEKVTRLPKAVLDLEPIKHALKSRELVVTKQPYNDRPKVKVPPPTPAAPELEAEAPAKNNKKRSRRRAK